MSQLWLRMVRPWPDQPDRFRRLCYITVPWLYFTLLDSTLIYQGSTSLYVTLHFSTMDLLHSTWLYTTLPWLYFTLLDPTLLYHGSTSFYFTLHYCTKFLLHSTLLYIDLPWLYFTLLDSALHYQGFTLLDSRLLNHGSTSLYFSLH